MKQLFYGEFTYYGIIIFILLIFISLIGININRKLYITDHTLTVYYEDCARDFVRQNPGSNNVFDLAKNISPECKAPEIDYLHEDYNYLFLFNLNRPNQKGEIVHIEIIDIDNDIVDIVDLDMHPNDNSIYLFITNLNVSRSEIVTFNISILAGDEELDEYSFKFKVLGTEIVV